MGDNGSGRAIRGLVPKQLNCLKGVGTGTWMTWHLGPVPHFLGTHSVDPLPLIVQEYLPRVNMGARGRTGVPGIGGGLQTKPCNGRNRKGTGG